MASRIAGYDGVAVAVPVTVPYERFSIRGAHWFVARALKALIDGAGISKDEIDGLCVASFTLAPDSAVGLTQHLGLSPRWLDHIPMGGARYRQPAPRGARRAGRRRRNRRLHRRRHQPDRQLPSETASFSMFAQDAVYPYGAGGPNGSFAFLTAYYMRTYGARPEDFGKLCVAQRTNALRNPNALFKKPLTLEEYLGARLVADPLRLFDCVMPCAGADAFLVMSEERAGGSGCRMRALPAPSSGTMPFPTIPCSTAAAGRWTAISSMLPPASAPPTSTWSRSMTTIPSSA